MLTFPRLFVALVTVIVRIVRGLARSRADLVLENLALRQQVATLMREQPRPHVDDADRGFWVALRQAWPGWVDRLVIVRPKARAARQRDLQPDWPCPESADRIIGTSGGTQPELTVGDRLEVSKTWGVVRTRPVRKAVGSARSNRSRPPDPGSRPPGEVADPCRHPPSRSNGAEKPDGWVLRRDSRPVRGPVAMRMLADASISPSSSCRLGSTSGAVMTPFASETAPPWSASPASERVPGRDR